MDLLIDTQILVWLQTGDRRLSQRALDALFDNHNRILVSSVTAWEYSDLTARGRLAVEAALGELVQDFAMTLVDFPAQAWSIARLLPDIHRDPIDRMLVAHAVIADMTVVSADETIRRYPVRAVW